MVRITHVYNDIAFVFYGYADFFLFLVTDLYCLDGCLSTIDAVLGVLYACALYFCICTCSVQLSMCHMEGALKIQSLLLLLLLHLVEKYAAKVSVHYIWYVSVLFKKKFANEDFL